jgi:hypothetical protein
MALAKKEAESRFLIILAMRRDNRTSLYEEPHTESVHGPIIVTLIQLVAASERYGVLVGRYSQHLNLLIEGSTIKRRRIAPAGFDI